MLLRCNKWFLFFGVCLQKLPFLGGEGFAGLVENFHAKTKGGGCGISCAAGLEWLTGAFFEGVKIMEIEAAISLPIISRYIFMARIILVEELVIKINHNVFIVVLGDAGYGPYLVVNAINIQINGRITEKLIRDEFTPLVVTCKIKSFSLFFNGRYGFCFHGPPLYPSGY